MNFIQSLKTLAEWMFENRKPVITYAVFTCFLVAFVKTSILAHDLQSLDSGWVMMLSLLLGIDLTHSAFEKFQDKKNEIKQNAPNIKTE